MASSNDLISEKLTKVNEKLNEFDDVDISNDPMDTSSNTNQVNTFVIKTQKTNNVEGQVGKVCYYKEV